MGSYGILWDLGSHKTDIIAGHCTLSLVAGSQWDQVGSWLPLTRSKCSFTLVSVWLSQVFRYQQVSIPTLYIHTPTDCGCDALMVYVGEQSPESGERGCVRVWVLVWGEWSVTMWVVLFVGFVCC